MTHIALSDIHPLLLLVQSIIKFICMKKAIIWVVGIIVVILIVIAVSGGKGGSTNGPIKIGVIAPMSGDGAVLGQEQKQVLDYRIAQINSKTPTGTAQFVLQYEDGKCSGSDAVSAFTKLTDVDGVKFVLTTCSSETLTVAPLANEKKVLQLSAMSSNPKVEDQGPYTMSFSYSDKKTSEDIAKVASVSKRIAILSEQTDFNLGIHDGVVEQLKKYPGVELVADETVPKGTTDFRAALTKIAATKPDAFILNPFVGNTAENLLKQLAAMKSWKGYKLISQIAYLADTSRVAVGKFAEGMTVVDVPALTNPELLALSGAIEAKSGTLKDIGTFYTASVIDVIDLLTNLIQKNGEDPTKVQQALATGSFKGFIGDIKFDNNNFVRFSLSGTYVIKDGKAVLQ